MVVASVSLCQSEALQRLCHGHTRPSARPSHPRFRFCESMRLYPQIPCEMYMLLPPAPLSDGSRTYDTISVLRS
jgi:hypothetical protein